MPSRSSARAAWKQRVVDLAGPTWVGRGRRLRARLTSALGIAAPSARAIPPASPVGAKLELTYTCNLRCAFCYTDSPRRTLEGVAELSDADWRAITEDVIDAGVIEAVVTGGEPLLRRDLVLEVIDRLDSARIGVCLNTNGWFVDVAVADRLARARSGLHVNVSLDGPTPELHDRARGVPGSWRRAVTAISLLVERGVPVHIVHVVTPSNEFAALQMVEAAWLLGASSVRLTPVVPIGAAAREGDWHIDERRLHRDARRMKERFGSEIDVIVAPEIQTSGSVPAPRFLVVRPNGAVMAGSLTPFRFGHALEDGIGACWQRIVRDWNHPNVQAWREPIRRGTPLPEAGAVIYRDDELEIDRAPPTRSPAPTPVELPRPARSLQAAGPGDFDKARRYLRDRALERRYRLGAVRWATGEGGARYVRSERGNVTRLNATAALVMDACTDGTPAEAVARLRARSNGHTAPRVEHDVLDSVKRLTSRGVLRPQLEPDRGP
jgi:MoaA/NifB/PqqE/SkfB family radical SAM enzyme